MLETAQDKFPSKRKQRTPGMFITARQHNVFLSISGIDTTNWPSSWWGGKSRSGDQWCPFCWTGCGSSGIRKGRCGQCHSCTRPRGTDLLWAYTSSFFLKLVTKSTRKYSCPALNTSIGERTHNVFHVDINQSNQRPHSDLVSTSWVNWQL